MDVTPTGETVPEIDIVRVMELIPHRYPLLMVDRVIDVVDTQRHTRLFLGLAVAIELVVGE